MNQQPSKFAIVSFEFKFAIESLIFQGRLLNGAHSISDIKLPWFKYCKYYFSICFLLSFSKKKKAVSPKLVNDLYFRFLTNCFTDFWTTFLFYLGSLSWTFMIHRTAEEEGGYLFYSSLALPHASQIIRHQHGDYSS